VVNSGVTSFPASDFRGKWNAASKTHRTLQKKLLSIFETNKQTLKAKQTNTTQRNKTTQHKQTNKHMTKGHNLFMVMNIEQEILQIAWRRASHATCVRERERESDAQGF